MTKKSIGRRNFIKITAIGTTGAALVPVISAAKTIEPAKTKRKVIRRKLGNTGLKLPIVSMGVMRADNPNLVKAALDMGIKHLDTAYVYQRGKNEEMLGKILKDYKRKSYTIATKVRPDKDTDKKGFLEMFETSMKRLQLDYVDILYHHMPSDRDSMFKKDFIDALTEIKKSGRAKHIGVSTHSKMPEIIKMAAEDNIYELVLTSINYQQDNADEVLNACKEAADAGIGIVAMKTMAGGFLDKEKTMPVNTKAALKWALKEKFVHTSIPGFTNYDMLEESFSIMQDIKLSQKEKDDLASQKKIGSMYCNACEECKPGCPMALPIPDIMRAYMYTYGYGETKKAHELISSLEIPDNPCDSCSSCTAKCVKGFDISAKISDVGRISNIPEEFLS